MHTLTSSNRVVWFCTSAPTNSTSFSSQPRPRVLHVIPLMPVPTSLEHLAQTPSLELTSLSTPYKRLLCPNSTRARAHTYHTHTVMSIRIMSTSCSLAAPSHRPSALSPRKPLALSSILFRGYCKPLLHILHSQSMTSPSALHSPSFLSFPGKSLLPPPSQEPCPINNSLSSLNVLSFLGWFFPIRHRIFWILQRLPGPLLKGW